MLDATRSLPMAPSGAAAPLRPAPLASRRPGTAPASPIEDGVFLVDAEARVLFANAAGRAILARRQGLRLEWQSLAAASAADTAALRRLVRGAGHERAGGGLVISCEDDLAFLVVMVPLTTGGERTAGGSPCAVLFAKDLRRVTQLSLDAFQRHYGLTPAQTALVQEIIKGDGVAATAARLGITYATARSHLQQVYDKTDARRQAELVSLALRWLGRPALFHLHEVADADTPRSAVGIAPWSASDAVEFPPP